MRTKRPQTGWLRLTRLRFAWRSLVMCIFTEMDLQRMFSVQALENLINAWLDGQRKGKMDAANVSGLRALHSLLLAKFEIFQQVVGVQLA